ncbi:MAG TPA: DPP IV N-terminal domain-containing protein [Flavitalea sp.]|nr:DPP IV N-terminal domain-containing protein [Flavitalea sp.]
MRIFIRVLFFSLVFVSGSYGIAQQKLFTYDQLFKGTATNIFKPLPVIRGWADDEHYLEIKKNEEGKSQTYSVEVKSGKAIPYDEKAEIKSAPSTSSLGLNNNERNVTFSPDYKWVAYTRNNNLFVTEVATKKERAITSDGSDVILNGYASWVYFEEILGRASRYRAFWWSPDSKKIAFMRFDDSQVPVFPIYVSTGQHGLVENQRYPKAGDKNPEVRFGIAMVENNFATVWADFDPKNDQYFGSPLWTNDNRLWVQWMNRGQDNLKIYEINLTNGNKTEIYDEKQPTWIDLDEGNRVEFLSGNNGFILKSDKNGWENLYLHDSNGKLRNAITTGNFWGTSILKIDEKKKLLFFRARKENSARYDLYRVQFDGKGLVRMSFGDYSHDAVMISPDGKYFITTYSNLSTPTTVALADMKGKVIRELGNMKGAEFADYAMPRMEMIRVPSSDGVFQLPVVITYPVNFDPLKRYPVLISIYGGPNAGTVYDRYRMTGGTTQWLAQEGIIQVSFDNRSSGHFGKIGLNYIHRQMGKWEIEDYMSCGRFLRAKPWVDTTRFAITGGSFGGYMTCMALTYGADVFTHGIANSSVTDWQLYDTHYTERFMDAPIENPEGYKNTSPITYAGNYKGLLRIIHGTSDDNVHMQNSIQLINKLEDLNKHFEMMFYPGERHGIGGAKGMHNRNEALAFYYKELLNKPMPAVFSGSSQRGF